MNNGPTTHVTADRLEEIAHRTGAEISMGGKHPTLVHDGVTYIADIDVDASAR